MGLELHPAGTAVRKWVLATDGSVRYIELRNAEGTFVDNMKGTLTAAQIERVLPDRPVVRIKRVDLAQLLKELRYANKWDEEHFDFLLNDAVPAIFRRIGVEIDMTNGVKKKNAY